MFRTDELAEDRFIELRWGSRVTMTCPKCGHGLVSDRKGHKPMPYQRNRKSLRHCFSVRTGTVMQSPKTKLRKWAIAYYLITTNLKGILKHKLARELSITQKSAWHMLHRIRQSWDDNS